MESFGGRAGVQKLTFLGPSFFRFVGIAASTIEGSAVLGQISGQFPASPITDPDATIGVLNLPGAQVSMANARADVVTAVSVSYFGSLLASNAVWTLLGALYMTSGLVQNGAKVTVDSLRILNTDFAPVSPATVFTNTSPALLDSFSNYSGVTVGGATFTGGVVIGV